MKIISYIRCKFMKISRKRVASFLNYYIIKPPAFIEESCKFVVVKIKNKKTFFLPMFLLNFKRFQRKFSEERSITSS